MVKYGAVFVVEGIVEAKFVNEKVNFFLTAGASQYATSFELGDLADNAADGTCSTGNDCSVSINPGTKKGRHMPPFFYA